MASTSPDDLKSNSGEFTIADLRDRIDGIDAEILRLINQRLRVATRIGQLKKADGNPVVDRGREVALLQRLNAQNKGPMNGDNLKHIFTEIISLSREIQQPCSVSYLGPEATFTHIAAMDYFGHFVRYISQDRIEDIFREVERGSCRYGVVPLESTVEGAVNPTLDLFLETELRICAEIFQTVSFDLLSREPLLNRIQTIYAQPQALALCRGWLQQHAAQATIEVCHTSAHAAQKAAQNTRTAAIAGNRAAHLYDLHILAAGIEDVTRKRTRFVAVGREAPPMSANDKTSVLFVAPNQPGALYRVLRPLAKSGINMVNLATSPTLQASWDDFFFMDLQGHINDPALGSALDSIREQCLYFKFLGSYPGALEQG